MGDQSTERALDALGDPVRRRILEALGERSRAVGELADVLPVGRPAVSKHLRVLSDAGLVVHRSVGTRNLYALAPAGLVTTQQWLVSTWDRALAAYSDEVRRVTTEQDPTTGAPDA